jgi:hypothetical protein
LVDGARVGLDEARSMHAIFVQANMPLIQLGLKPKLAIESDWRLCTRTSAYGTAQDGDRAMLGECESGNVHTFRWSALRGARSCTRSTRTSACTP